MLICHPCSQAEIAQGTWKDLWYSQFDWLDFSLDLKRVSYKVCKEKGEHLSIPMRDQFF